jgi:hypothetical protein
MSADGLATWNDGPARARTVEFVEGVDRAGDRDNVEAGKGCRRSLPAIDSDDGYCW